ncbi:putative G-protein coupled receptor 179 [Leptosomus discolor]
MGPWWWWPLLRCLYAVLVHGTVLAGGQRLQERPPQLAGWSPTSLSSWVPTPESGASGDPEGSAAALAFLQTGDAQRLAQANCSRGVAAGAPGPGPPPALRVALRAAPEALAHAANFLNMLFQTNDIREASVAEDVEWYQALVRSLAEGHPWVRRAVLALDAHPLAAKPRLMLQATKGDGEILLQDVSAAAPSLGNLSWDNEWFNAFKSQRTPLLLRKRVLSNDLRSMETPKWQRGDSYVGEPGHVRWSPPFLECRDGKFLPAWTVTLSSAFYGLKPDLSPEFKGVVRVDIELRDVAIDQCASGPGWFADTHRCDLNSTQCVPQESRGFVLGRYLCRCKPGFYGAGGVASGARAGVAGSTAGADGGSRLACRPCRQGCATCKDDAPCLIQEDRALRAAILSCQACCMLAVFLSMLVSYHFRRSKRIRASGVILLETILFGSLLLYFPVFILYFKPSIFRCIVLRWVRLLGFAIVYGTITLKLYRVLKVFLSRTAQRAPYVSSGQVLKMLGLILLLVLWFLAAWTIGMLENVEKNIPLVIRTQTARGLHFYICSHDHWDYMMVIAEMLFLLWGSFLCYATRAVPSAFHEPRYMGIALHNELMISAAFHVVRFIMVPSLHPDWTLLLFFAHTHGTITMTLALLFIPKFLHAGSPLREEIAAEVYEDELDLRRSGSCLNSSIASAWSEHSLDPDDIREELKKLYMQLEVHKTRRMAANNPHLPKKRSSRRSLARSIARRGAEPPEAAARRGSSAKRLPNAGGTSLRLWEDGSRRHAAAPRKSLSAEGPPRGGSLTPSPPGRKAMVTPASEQSDSESLDDAPLVCKSASAHNLVGHGQPPPPRAAPLQKSLSVVAGAREEALLAASQAAREVWRANRHLSAPSSQHPTGQGHPKEAGKPRSPGAADALRPAGSSPAEGWPQEDTSPPGDGKVQKHVTYAPVKSISIDSSHLPGRVRVAVRRTPPRPPVRYQSLGRRAVPAGDSPEPAEPPADPLERAGEPEGTPAGMVEEDAGQTSPAAGKGRLLPAASLPAQVCPWELVQEEILSRKQKAAEAADSGTLGDTAATPPSIKPPSQKTSFRSLGLAIKAFNRSRGKSILRGKREGEGSLRKRGHEREGGSRRERLSRAETAAASPEGIGRDPTAKSPEWSRQRPGSEPTARPWQGDAVPCQQNNNAGTAWEATGWGDGRGETEGQRDSPALGTGDGEKPAEEPSAPQGDADDGRAQEPPSGVHKVPPSVGPQGAEHPPGSPEAASSGKAWIRPQEGAEAPMAEAGKDAPAATVRLLTPKEGAAGLTEGLEGASRSLCPQDRAEVEQPHAKAVASSNPPSTTGVRRAAAEKAGAEVWPRGAPGTPGGRGALLHQEAIASQEDPGVPLGEESPAKALEKRGSQPEPLGPGGSRGTERVPPRSQSMEVAPAAVGKATRAAGRQAEVCPGETHADSSIKIKICPWEESGGPGRALGKGSSEGDPSRPREKPGVEEPLGKTPGLLKAASEKAGSVEGRRAEVCPWEAAGADSDADVCPWERGTALSHAGKLDDGKISQVKKGISPQRAGETAPAADKGSSQRGSPHPRGGAAKHPALPKTPSKQAGTTDSKKADICPWEVEDEPIAKTEICPWEEPAAPSGKEKPSQDTPGTSKGENKPGSGGFEDIKAKLAEMGGHQPGRRDMEISAKLIRKSLESSRAESKKSQSEEASRDRESVCPWESLGAEQPPEQPRARSPALPPSPSKQSQSVESLKAEVCPWEAPEVEAPEKAEICPWEVAAAPSDQPKAKQGPGGGSKGDKRIRRQAALASPVRSLEKGSSEREAVCPWESLSSEQPPEKPHAESPALPQTPSKKSQSGESLKAEVCPWELESSEKAKICPWEAAALPLSKEKPRQDRDALPTVSKRPSRGQGLSKGIGDGTSGKKEEASRDRESVCPWESADTEGSSTGYSTKSTELLKATAGKSGSTGSTKAEVCPWESLGAEQPPEQPRARSPALPPSPSKQSQSVESLKAEVCPWEAPEIEAPEKAKICPWEAAAPLQEKGAAPGKVSLPPKKAGASKLPEKGSSEHEAICPWESLGTEELSLKTAPGKEPSKKSDSSESRKTAICPWEAAEPTGSEKESFEPSVPPQGAGRASPMGTEKSQAVAGARAVAPTALLKKSKGRSDGEAEHKPLCRILPGIQPGPTAELPPRRASTAPAAGSSPSPSASVAEVCPWETEEAPSASDKTSTDTRKTSEVCPWEVESVDPTPTLRGQGRAGVSPQDGGRGVSETKPDVCPWDHE